MTPNINEYIDMNWKPTTTANRLLENVLGDRVVEYMV